MLLSFLRVLPVLKRGDHVASNLLICRWGTGRLEGKKAFCEAHQTVKREAARYSGILSGTSKPEAIFLTEQPWELQLKFTEHLPCARQASKPSGVLIPLTLTTLSSSPSPSPYNWRNRGTGGQLFCPRPHKQGPDLGSEPREPGSSDHALLYLLPRCPRDLQRASGSL